MIMHVFLFLAVSWRFWDEPACSVLTWAPVCPFFFITHGYGLRAVVAVDDGHVCLWIDVLFISYDVDAIWFLCLLHIFTTL